MAAARMGGFALMAAALVLCAWLAPTDAAKAATAGAVQAETSATPLPVVIWHGMGDNYDSKGMHFVSSAVTEATGGAHVHLVKLASSPSDDAEASFIGRVSDQIDAACAAIAADDTIASAGAYNAIGFSQGGQFLRGLVEACQSKPDMPQMRTLVTFGAQHQGVMSYKCENQNSATCRWVEWLLSIGAYSDYCRHNIVQAQYFKDYRDLDTYLEKNIFLPVFNNEKATPESAQYKRNLQSLDRLVLFMWTEDDMVIPKESSWFYEFNATSDAPIPLEKTAAYRALGLDALAEKGKLELRTIDGVHMMINSTFLEGVVRQYM